MAVRPGSEEYLDSEKFEAHDRTLDGPLLPLVADLNRIRRSQPALPAPGAAPGCSTPRTPALLAYAKRGRRATPCCAWCCSTPTPPRRACASCPTTSASRRASRSRTASPASGSAGSSGATTCASSPAAVRRTCSPWPSRCRERRVTGTDDRVRHGPRRSEAAEAARPSRRRRPQGHEGRQDPEGHEATKPRSDEAEGTQSAARRPRRIGPHRGRRPRRRSAGGLAGRSSLVRRRSGRAHARHRRPADRAPLAVGLVDTGDGRRHQLLVPGAPGADGPTWATIRRRPTSSARWVAGGGTDGGDRRSARCAATGCRGAGALGDGARPPLGGEQSNTSVVVGGTHVLKLLRRLQPGIHPEVEVGRHLAAVADGPTHQLPGRPASPAGTSSAPHRRRRRRPTTLGVVQELVPGALDAWGLVLSALAGDPGAPARPAPPAGRRAGPAPRGPGPSGRRVRRRRRDPARSGPSPSPAAGSTRWSPGWRPMPDGCWARTPRTPPTRPRRRAGAPRSPSWPSALADRLGDRPGVGHPAPRRPAPRPGRARPRRLGGPRLRGRADPPARRAPPPALAAARRGRDAPLVRLRRRHPPPGRGSPAGPGLGAGGPRRVPRRLPGHRRAPRCCPTSPAATRTLLTLLELEKVVYEIDYELAHRPDWVDVARRRASPGSSTQAPHEPGPRRPGRPGRRARPATCCAEGRHLDLHHHLGAHLGTVDGDRRAWPSRCGRPAASARVGGGRLELLGSRRHTRWRGLDGSDVWAAFVPDAREGHRYKFAVTGPDGATVEHADPLAFRSRGRARPPARSSTVPPRVGRRRLDGGGATPRPVGGAACRSTRSTSAPGGGTRPSRSGSGPSASWPPSWPPTSPTWASPTWSCCR